MVVTGTYLRTEDILAIARVKGGGGGSKVIVIDENITCTDDGDGNITITEDNG